MKTPPAPSAVTALLAAALALPLPTAAQDAQQPPETPPSSTDILQTILLPRVAEVLRDQGVPVEEVREAVAGARTQGIPAAETTGVLETTVGAVEAQGPIENFGAFVQARLAEGLRGRALADAIRAEHAARGIGQGRRLEQRGGPEGGRGGPPDGRGGPPDGRGGRPDERGGPDDARGGSQEGRGGPPEARGGAPGERGGPPEGRGRPAGTRPDTTGGADVRVAPGRRGGGA